MPKGYMARFVRLAGKHRTVDGDALDLSRMPKYITQRLGSVELIGPRGGLSRQASAGQPRLD